jgi:uncharacterized OB-fold protein
MATDAPHHAAGDARADAHADAHAEPLPGTGTDARFDGPGPDACFRQALLDGRFELQHCEDCAAARFPPALVCRACGSARLAWRASPGAGEVYATTTVRDRAGDYNVCIVELEQGARMMSRVDDLPAGDVHIGLRVQARIVPGEEPFVVFMPASGLPDDPNDVASDGATAGTTAVATTGATPARPDGGAA